MRAASTGTALGERPDPDSVRVRPAAAEDVPACLDVFYEAIEELHERAGQPVMPRNHVPLGRLFEHLITTDPQRSWVAEVAGAGVVAFGLANRREDTWFLGFLFVLPAFQALGLGRRLIEACLASDRPPVLAVCAESIQPVSIGLYSSLGMLPRAALFAMTGHRRDDLPLAAVHDLVAVPFEEAQADDRAGLAADLAEIDRATLGYAHPQDHAFWDAMDRRGYLFRDSGSGAAVGYGYVTSSGRIGPVAMRDPRWLPEAIDHLMAAVKPPDAWLVFVPGQSSALGPLLRAGLRIDGPPALYQATQDGPAFDRYLLGNFAVL